MLETKERKVSILALCDFYWKFNILAKLAKTGELATTILYTIKLI